MSDWTPGRPRQPERPPRLELVDRCWRMRVLASNRELVCGIFRADGGLEVRAGYRDELLRSQLCRDEPTARTVAAKLKTLLLAEVGEVEELPVWVCGKCQGAAVPEHHRTCPHRTTSDTEPTEVIDVPSSADEIERIAASVGFLLPTDKGLRH